MGIDKFNAEGYYDPTCYEAMTNVVKADRQSAFRPMVYICSPFSGDTEYNIVQARKPRTGRSLRRHSERSGTSLLHDDDERDVLLFRFNRGHFPLSEYEERKAIL